MRKQKMPPKYPNLVAEMTRTGVEVSDICEVTGKSKSSVYDYMRGVGNGCFTIDDAFAIQKKYFPTLTVSYLFSETPEVGTAAAV